MSTLQQNNEWHHQGALDCDGQPVHHTLLAWNREHLLTYNTGTLTSFGKDAFG